MKKTVFGFALLISILLLSWLLKDLMISTVLLPMLLGAVQFGRLMNSIPQFVWWIFLCVFSLSLFFVNLKFPDIPHLNKKTIEIGRGRLSRLESLINETMKSSSYSGQQLSLTILNLYLKNKGREVTNIHGMDKYLKDESLPDEIKDFVLIQQSRKTNPQAVRLSLEKAVSYLNTIIIGDISHD
ncbi:hypothetical protein HNV12_26865 [Methanococcoides sp. SA1]|nr:hypothetical protein [Methanococcoides sp. SA1]